MNEKQLKKGEQFNIRNIHSTYGWAMIDHPEFGRDAIKPDDFGKLEESAMVAQPSVWCLARHPSRGTSRQYRETAAVVFAG